MSNPVFVRGFSRSGGTLMVTILDSHPDIAMSYEQYPDLLEIDDTVDEAQLAEAIDASEKLADARSLCPGNGRFGTYLARYPRGGFDQHDFARHYRQVLDEGLSLKTPEGRIRMMEIGGEEKMNNQGKSKWGMKCLPSNYTEFVDRWPDSRYVSMVRDPRDVAASQIENLSREGVEKVAKGWVSNVKKYRQFSKKNPNLAYTMIYENLVREPEKEIRDMMTFFQIPFSQRMMEHDQQDLTIHKANHISGPRVAKPIDDSQVGRWRNDLTPEQVDKLVAIAGEEMARMGYK